MAIGVTVTIVNSPFVFDKIATGCPSAGYPWTQAVSDVPRSGSITSGKAQTDSLSPRLFNRSAVGDPCAANHG